MRICATDQSSSRSGLAVIVDGVPTYYTAIDHSSNKDVADRIKHMFLDLSKCIDEANPDYLVVEAVQQQTNPKAVMILSTLQGGLICRAYTCGIPVSSPLPTEWRKILGFRQGPKIKREELKAQAKDFVLQHFSITASEDECEAICIGVAEYLRLNDLDVSNLQK